jgi:hypothetical protein
MTENALVLYLRAADLAVQIVDGVHPDQLGTQLRVASGTSGW